MNEKIKMIEGGVTAAKGFMAASTAAGIKYKNRQDMAMIFTLERISSFTNVEQRP
jgi:glutamate N-acetyltransferase / amino-acid N-acetyltransferase